MPSEKTIGVLLATISSIAFGIAYVLVKWGLQELGPWYMTFLRLLLTVVTVAAYFAIRQVKWWPTAKERWKEFVLLGIIGSFVTIGVANFGINMTTAINSGLLSCLSPVFVPILAFYILKERASKIFVAALVIAIVGSAVIAIGDSPIITGGSAIGDIIVIFAAFCWALYIVLGKRLMGKVSPSIIMFLTFLFSLPFFAIASVAEGIKPVTSSLTAYSVIGLSVFCTTMAFFAYMEAVKRLKASVAGFFGYVEMLVAVVAPIILLGEVLGVAAITGGALIVVSLALAQKG